MAEGARRCQVADLIQAPAEDIFFLPAVPEADNLALLGVTARFPEGGHVITTPIEHSAILESCDYLEEHGFDVDLSAGEFGRFGGPGGCA